MTTMEYENETDPPGAPVGLYEYAQGPGAGEENSSAASTGAGEDYDYFNIEYRVRVILRQPHGVVAITFGTVSILLNLVILLCLYKVQNRITSHYRLIISLAVADMLVAATVLLYKVNKTFNPIYPISAPWSARVTSTCSFLIIKAMNTTGLNVTLLNLMAMAVDHYIAIMKPLQYPMIMTRGRVIGSIVVIWVVALLLGFSDFLSAFAQYYSQTTPLVFNYCEIVTNTEYQEEFTVFANAPMCLGVMIFVYTRIYRKVLHHRRPGVEESLQRRRETRRTSKALITTLLNIGTFIIAWLPLCLLEVSLLVIVKTNPKYLTSLDVQRTLIVTNQHLFNLLIFNAIADPIIYTVRMREVQVGFIRLFGRCLPCCALYRKLSPTHSMGLSSHNKLLKRNSSYSVQDRELKVLSEREVSAVEDSFSKQGKERTTLVLNIPKLDVSCDPGV